MTEKEVEKAYKKMTESDAPDLWAKIESNLPEKEVRTEKESKDRFFCKTWEDLFRRQLHGRHRQQCVQFVSLY